MNRRILAVACLALVAMGARPALKYVSSVDGSQVQEFLFDLDADPGEQTNLLGARPADRQRLEDKLKKWEQEVKARR